MAAIPAALKSADIARFAQRAAQLEKAKPVVAYWCNYWIIEQIISRNLQNADEESMSYSLNLMNKLEQAKTDNADNDAISDEMASQAYIEQFASETFQRAEKAMSANKASRQTADTFLAAATFLELCQIWAPLEQDMVSRIKYAKYHAVRIAKAIKAGEDPNASNPAPEPPRDSGELGLDPADSTTSNLDPSNDRSQNQVRPFQPSVEDVPDEHDRVQHRLAQHSALDESLHPSRATSGQRNPDRDSFAARHDPPSPQEPGEAYYQHAAAGEVSPIVSPAQASPQNNGYFPDMPQENATAPFLPQVPSENPQSASFPPQSSPPHDASYPYGPPSSSLHSFPPPPNDLTSATPGVPIPHSHPPPGPAALWNVPIQPPPVQPRRIPPVASVPHAAPVPTSTQSEYRTDEEAILKAQKHARWAISALNFEDVKTAVQELRGALESLGA
ncbi:vacuolar protein sorting-associated protein vts1 [Physcia stellaris]|nr:vacuolar protein sorting-associated protein vts1 [Physcia stellaris]